MYWQAKLDAWGLLSYDDLWDRRYILFKDDIDQKNFLSQVGQISWVESKENSKNIFTK